MEIIASTVLWDEGSPRISGALCRSVAQLISLRHAEDGAFHQFLRELSAWTRVHKGEAVHLDTLLGLGAPEDDFRRAREVLAEHVSQELALIATYVVMREEQQALLMRPQLAIGQSSGSARCFRA